MLNVCVCVCIYMYVLFLFSCQVLSDSFATPWTVAHQGSLSMGFPGKNTGVSCHFLLQSIFPLEGKIRERLRDWTHISCIGRWILYHWATEEALYMCVYVHLCVCVCVCVCVCSVAQSCPTLCDPTVYNPPSSSVHGIFQARKLEWVAIFLSKGSSWPRDQTCTPLSPALAGRFFTTEPLGKSHVCVCVCVCVSV